jgi:hypothetical protein
MKPWKMKPAMGWVSRPLAVQTQSVFRDTHLSVIRKVYRRSWHLCGVVNSVGCPGVIGPIPQPVSISCLQSILLIEAGQEPRCLAAIAGVGLGREEFEGDNRRRRSVATRCFAI